METVDFSTMIVGYNFVIGFLVLLSSEKFGIFVGNMNQAHRERVARLTQVSTFTFGAAVATLSALIYVLFHVLRIGV